MKAKKKISTAVPDALIGEPVGILSIGLTVYRIYKLDEDHDDQALTVKYGYRLFGPKNQSFYLMRNLNAKSLMFAIDSEGHPSDTFKNVWFTDVDGQLKIA